MTDNKESQQTEAQENTQEQIVPAQAKPVTALSPLSWEDDDDIVELDSSDEAVLAAEAVADALMRRIDPDSAFPRQITASAQETFKWNLREDAEFPEISDGNVVALRGVPIKFKFGLKLYDSNNSRMLCYTTSSNVSGMPVVKSDQPMTIPFYGPQQYKKENEPSDPLFKFNTMGSRGESCIDCVRNGHSVNRYKKLNDNGQPVVKDGVEVTHEDACGLNASVIFCVMALGVSSYNNVTRKTTVRWVNAVDYVDSNSNKPFDGPFILNMRISRKPVLDTVGRNVQLKLESSGGTSIVPTNVLTLSSYIQNLKEKNKQSWAEANEELHGLKLRQINKDVCEVYLALPMQGFENQMIKSWPVFKSVTDPEVLGEWPVKKWVSFAWKVYEAERMSYYGMAPMATAIAAGSEETVPKAVTASAPVIQKPTPKPVEAPKVSTTKDAPVAQPTDLGNVLDDLTDVFSRRSTSTKS